MISASGRATCAAGAAATSRRLRTAVWALPLAAALLLGCQQRQEVDTEEDVAADTIGELDTAPEASEDAASVPDTVLEPDTAGADTAVSEETGVTEAEVAAAPAAEAAAERPAPAAPAAEPAPEAEPAATESAEAAPPPAPSVASHAGSSPAQAETGAATPAPSSSVDPPAPAPAPETAAPADTPAARAAEAAAPAAPAGQPSLQATASQYNGWKQFSANCERCHGQDAVGSSFAPSLVRSVGESSVATGAALTKEQFVETVMNGRLDKGMPAWKDLLSQEQVNDMWEYLSARASGELAPGRPTRAGG